MKYWPSQFFPIIVLALLAGLTFWLQSTVDQGEMKTDGKLRHDPDAIAENLVVRRFDELGQVKYRLTTPYLVHFPDDDTSELRTPILTSYRQDRSPVTLSANHAKVTAKGEVAYLWDNVQFIRPAEQGRPQLVARSPDLTVHPETGHAFTSSPVEIIQGQSWVRGVGVEIDNQNSTFVLQSQVKGQYIRPGATP